MSFLKKIFRKKDVSELIKASEKIEASGGTLRRSLGPINLISLGIGGIIGTGIFVITGNAAAHYAGPGLILSFIFSGIGCAFAALCYAEFAALIPIAGSAYSYAYATLGEIFAWIIGWDLVLEYLFAAATVAVGWSGYFTSLLSKTFGINLPASLTAATGTELVYYQNSWLPLNSQLIASFNSQGIELDSLPQITAIINLPAVLIILLISTLLYVGIKESARFNNLMVFVKVSIILLFVLIGWKFVNYNNLTPFIPENTGNFGEFGWSGVLRAAGVIFFAYIGFDSVSTLAQEAKNPQRDMPIGILGSLAICTLLYIAVTFVLTGIVHYSELGVAEPIAKAIDSLGGSLSWLSFLIKIGAIAGLSSVILVLILGQTRVFYSMARDGLLPQVFSKISQRYGTPTLATVVTGTVAAILAGTLPIGILGELVSIGTLLAFVIVCFAILVLRKTQPHLHRPFKTPLVPLVPILGILISGAQMAALPLDTWLRLAIWMAIGGVIYIFYGYKRADR
ncbi:MAG TPA: amino acid permease [Oligoflexia bacterium]|nr:amino acid permease [Oligoflexia bacterium]HMP26703.1 amino acid permease [Oligoflexia bacterium]